MERRERRVECPEKGIGVLDRCWWKEGEGRPGCSDLLKGERRERKAIMIPDIATYLSGVRMILVNLHEPYEF